MEPKVYMYFANCFNFGTEVCFNSILLVQQFWFFQSLFIRGELVHGPESTEGA